MVRAWHGRGMASVNQTQPHCVNQMGKTHSKPLVARHGRGKAGARHGHGMLCESAFMSRSQWHNGLRDGFAAVCLLGLQVRIPSGEWMSVAKVFFFWSGKNLFVGVITRLEA